MSIYTRLLKESPDLILLTLVLLSIPTTTIRVLGVLLILLTLYIHRSPEINSESVGSNQTIVTEFCTAPSYGTVVKVDPDLCSIRTRLGLNDIHIQCVPYSGTIKTQIHSKKSVITVINTSVGEIKITQTGSGLLSKIVNFCNIGDKVKRGDQLGFIRFGGYTDIVLPPNAQILVWPDEKTNGPNSVIAHLK